MAFARNQFCRLYFGKDRKYLNEEEMKEYFRLAKKMSRAENEELYQKDTEYNKRYYREHREHLLEVQREWKKNHALEIKRKNLIAFIRKHGHKPHEGGKFYQKYGVRKKDATPEMLRDYNRERIRKYKLKKLAQTFDKCETEV